jgi:hypothetical protein
LNSPGRVIAYACMCGLAGQDLRQARAKRVTLLVSRTLPLSQCAAKKPLQSVARSLRRGTVTEIMEGEIMLPMARPFERRATTHRTRAGSGNFLKAKRRQPSKTAILLGVQEVPGSNPGGPTKRFKHLHTVLFTPWLVGVQCGVHFAHTSPDLPDLDGQDLRQASCPRLSLSP